MYTSELATELVRKWKFVTLPAVGTSMVPVIHPGDLLHVRRAALEEISPGDIVVYARHGRMIAHRVVATGAAGTREPYLITRGDRSQTSDSPLFSSELIGLVAVVERNRQCYRLCPQLNIAQRLLLSILRSSDRATSLYLRAASLRRGLRFGGAEWQR